MAASGRRRAVVFLQSNEFWSNGDVLGEVVQQSPPKQFWSGCSLTLADVTALTEKLASSRRSLCDKMLGRDCGSRPSRSTPAAVR